jgi:hypothetical protein
MLELLQENDPECGTDHDIFLFQFFSSSSSGVSHKVGNHPTIKPHSHSWFCIILTKLFLPTRSKILALDIIVSVCVCWTGV